MPVELQAQGFSGRDWASVAELAERLQTKPHATLAPVTRCEQAGLVRRRENDRDHRIVGVHLSPKGRRVLERMVASLEDERQALARVLEEGE